MISYQEMCRKEGLRLRRGMYYRPGKYSLVLVSPMASYEDTWREGGRILLYQGHDAPKKGRDLDQPYRTKTGKLTQNGLFFEAVKAFKLGKRKAEVVKVYEKVATGIWRERGLFRLVDGWRERKRGRVIFRFKLEKIANDSYTQKEKGERS
ncbi:MAG: hypothetical protein QXG22_03120 [Candidatus Hadarchaeales archaeon]